MRLGLGARSCVSLAVITAGVIGPVFTDTGAERPMHADAMKLDKEPVRKVPAVKAASRTMFPQPLADADLDVFRGLGAWVDLFDVGLDARSYVARMKANGVRTLYLQTGRSNSDRAVDSRVNPWLVAAHDAGIKVVGWYLPFYVRHKLDVERTLEVARYEYQGHRFDGVGVDIEYRAAVRGAFTWNRRVVQHLAAVQRRLGPGYPLASIPPTPLQMRVAPTHWAGFPWPALGEHSHAILLMSYWSDRIGCPQIRRHCPYEFTARNVQLTRKLIGRDDRIIHVIGGVGDEMGERDIHDFIRGALDSAADGASIYDARTTREPWWRDLAALRSLG